MAFCWGDLLFELDRDLKIAFAEGAVQAFFGKTAAQLRGVSFRDLVMASDVPLAGQILKAVLKPGRVHDRPLRLKLANGQAQPVMMSAYCLNATDAPIFLALRRGAPPPAAVAAAGGDAVPPGRAFADLAASRLYQMRQAGEPAELSLVSLPGLEGLQSRLAPEGAEAMIGEVDQVLLAHSVGGDAAAKVADGRYSIVHPAEIRAEDLARQIEAVTRKFDVDGIGLAVETATLSMEDAAGISEEDLAKGLLYTLGKFCGADGGGASLKEISANMTALVGEAVAEVNHFKQVVAQRDFYVALQPIVHIATGEIHHYEALCRFDRAAKESPFKTITFAEETGLIHDFDFAMARKVVEWLGKFPRNNDRYRVAVNVSGYSIGKESYVQSLHALLRDNDWTKGKLMFEITESSRMSDLDSANAFIKSLRDAGYHVCLDDFGAGAASFQYLSVLDVDVVKLDGSAVKNAQKADKGRAFLSALTELCRRMGVETIAEMVDTPETLEFCRECGCNYVQGYLFGKPSKEILDFSPLPQINLFKNGQKPRC